MRLSGQYFRFRLDGNRKGGVLRAIVQRVLTASVSAEGKTIANIGPGLLVFIAIGIDDQIVVN